MVKVLYIQIIYICSSNTNNVPNHTRWLFLSFKIKINIYKIKKHTIININSIIQWKYYLCLLYKIHKRKYILAVYIYIYKIVIQL